MIKFEEVSKKFAEITALDKISFEIKDGEMVFLTGPSGAGKTTLIKLILKELEPTTGKISINGLDLSKIKRKHLYALRRKIGVVFQDFKLLNDRTVRENVALALEVTGLDRKKVTKEVEEILEMVGLFERADLFPSQLAGGELQRACLARAIVPSPEILIADEPTGNLDVATAWQIFSLLQEVNRAGKTVLVTTHNFEIVDSLKIRVIELDHGKLVRDEEKGQYKVK
ncbi:MAG TPA: cell division ATP-binding protein FtsE [Candidatus Bathyarchaeia archaeon]|nr:cell division ATP-binding protein FtsE [Candidatus Bathyarchaeia archaeon]